MTLRRVVLAGVVILAAAAIVVFASVSASTGTTGTKVSVTEKEFKLTAAPGTAKAGKVDFVIKNVGKLDHEFVVLKTDVAPSKLPLKGATAAEPGHVATIPPFKPGQTREVILTLKPGKYVLLCNVPAHYKAGQRAGFTVG